MATGAEDWLGIEIIGYLASMLNVHFFCRINLGISGQ